MSARSRMPELERLLAPARPCNRRANHRCLCRGCRRATGRGEAEFWWRAPCPRVAVYEASQGSQKNGAIAPQCGNVHGRW